MNGDGADRLTHQTERRSTMNRSYTRTPERKQAERAESIRRRQVRRSKYDVSR